MDTVTDILSKHLIQAIKALYNTEIKSDQLLFQKTNKGFEGDTTVNVFPLLKTINQYPGSKKPGSPENLANEIGAYLKNSSPEIAGFNVVKGFLNIVISKTYWLNFFIEAQNIENYGLSAPGSSGKTIMVEYSSPNTNKPLHLGHIRNNLLGYSVAEILKAIGNNVIKVTLVNDRGIHICKSMLAWKRWGNGETPQSAGLKGDHLVGKYYVEFDKQYKKEIEQLVSAGSTQEDAEKKAPLMQEIQEMLRKWEAGDKEILELWKTMNTWVYNGFDTTYKTLGVDFDQTYYESNTYLLGKKIVEEGLAKGVFFKKDDGSVWIDLTADGLDQKIVMRSDGTSVYMTQDIGTAVERFKENPNLKQLIYTVGNEQDYHFKVLFLILKKLGYQWADECYHLSYGMVELPEGKMKSREGTVVDADDLIKEMLDTAKETTLELGKVNDLDPSETEKLYNTVGLGALKYFMLKVDPKKKMLFDPKESIDFNGHTGPFIQYTHARIQSVLRKADSSKFSYAVDIEINDKEKELIKLIYEFPATLKDAANTYNPSHVANYAYELVKGYNQFYHDVPILKEPDEQLKNFRLSLSQKTASIIKTSMRLLGIEVPERM